MARQGIARTCTNAHSLHSVHTLPLGPGADACGTNKMFVVPYCPGPGACECAAPGDYTAQYAHDMLMVHTALASM
jgi:hypothetical protein